MSTKKHNLHEANDRFLDALTAYQTANLRMCKALAEMTDHTADFYASLDSVIRKTAFMLREDR